VKTRSRARAVYTVLAVLCSLVFLMPVLWLVASAFRSAAETFATASPVGWEALWPREWTLDNFRSAADAGFFTALRNSLVVAAVSVVLGLGVSAAAAFALAVIPFPGRGGVFIVVVLSFLVPFEAIAIPLSRSFSEWGLTNTLMALILPGLGNGLAVFTLRQFFLGVPDSLAEAAHVDGAGWPRIFVSIYLPLAWPSLIGASLILFLFQWQAYLWPILVTSTAEMDLAPVAIARSFGAFTVDYGRVFAETTILAVIPAVVLLVLQRFFVASVSSTGEKG
jgi:multiple sugar transport system permease protein/putative chitobiose transport system permease protein